MSPQETRSSAPKPCGMSAQDWQFAIRAVANPLPGQLPQDNFRPVNIPGAFAGLPMVDALLGMFPHIAAHEWQQRLMDGRFFTKSGKPITDAHRVKGGEQLLQVFRNEIEPDVSSEVRVIYADSDLLVIQKPAPLPMHPCGRFRRNTLQHWLELAVPSVPVRPIHRLDANTTGLVVMALNVQACKSLQQQFLSSEVEKVYLVATQGKPSGQQFVCTQKIASNPCEVGVRVLDPEHGDEAYTEFRVIERYQQSSLMEARLGTGRTNQIRAHLWSLGYPVLGDPSYLQGLQIGEAQTLTLSAEPLCLHAWRLSFWHPSTKTRMSFQTEMPVWASHLP